ncbi:unnamed protein product [Prorocentrum cordatum]|uniref:Uncharacterized protein n=1 Tax=Prorocentrum cordatum TaxID=2364126 RepID=A0ABN9WRD2_9DINO|nr:unnamed protein product [Polarella glacialis]
MAAKHGPELQSLAFSTSENMLGRELRKPFAKHKISWTKEHQVSSEPNKKSDDIYESTVSLHDPCMARRWCSILAQQRQAVPIAIIGLGEADPTHARAVLQIPVPRVGAGAGKPKKTFLKGAIYQFGQGEVTCQTNIATVQALADDQLAATPRVTIYEKDAVHANPDISQLSQAQFLGATPILTQRGSRDTLGADKNTRYKHAKKPEARIALDDQLREHFTKIIHTIKPGAKLLEPPSRMMRAGTEEAVTPTREGRTWSVTFVVAKGEVLAYLKLSGFKGITFANSYSGNPEQAEKDKEDTFVVWLPSATATLHEAYEIALKCDGHQGVMRSDKRSVGIRMARTSPQAKELAIEVSGNAASLARQKFRIDHIPPNMASNPRIQTVAADLHWQCEVANVGYGSREQSHYAIVKAYAPPGSTCWRVGHGKQPWVITAMADKPELQQTDAAPTIVLADELDKARAQKMQPTQQPPASGPTAAAVVATKHTMGGPTWLTHLRPAGALHQTACRIDNLDQDITALRQQIQGTTINNAVQRLHALDGLQLGIDAIMNKLGVRPGGRPEGAPAAKTPRTEENTPR